MLLATVSDFMYVIYIYHICHYSTHCGIAMGPFGVTGLCMGVLGLFWGDMVNMQGQLSTGPNCC